MKHDYIYRMVFRTRDCSEEWFEGCDQRAQPLIEKLGGDIFAGDADYEDGYSEWSIGFSVKNRLSPLQIKLITSVNSDIQIQEEEDFENDSEEEEESEEDEESDKEEEESDKEEEESDKEEEADEDSE
jgi:hypothetical protein